MTPDCSPDQARLAAADAFRHLADYAAAVVCSAATAGEHEPGELAATISWLGVHLQELRFRVVMAERAAGATWGHIAAGLRQPEQDVRLVFEPMYERWQAGDHQPWAPQVDGQPAALMPVSGLVDAEVVRRWLSHHRFHVPGAPAAVPVSGDHSAA